jgi:replication-associated recombination protein RarA
MKRDDYRPTTRRGYNLDEVISALQKSIRRGDARLAVYFSMELFESGFEQYAWRRLLTCSAEDIAGITTTEIKSLFDSADVVRKARTPDRIFLAKAAIVLARAEKSRDADHASCLGYDLHVPSDQDIRRAIDDARDEVQPIPDYALDVHARRGRAAGKTKTDFFLDEFDALSPRTPGLFDSDVEALRRGERTLKKKS